MEDDLKQLMREQLQLQKESLVILKKLHKDVILRRVFNFLKFALIIGFTILGYVQLKPFLDQWLGTISNLQGALPKGSLPNFLNQ